jgi:hypothetical protein
MLQDLPQSSETSLETSPQTGSVHSPSVAAVRELINYNARHRFRSAFPIYAESDA